jgi:hypothetical protein
LEFEERRGHRQGASEHIKEVAEVVSYVILCRKGFARLVDKRKDNAETVLAGFPKVYNSVSIWKDVQDIHYKHLLMQ